MVLVSAHNFSGGLDLRESTFRSSWLNGVDFSGADLTGADLSEAMLTNANLSGAIVKGAIIGVATPRGFTKEQLYSTASYQAKDLRGIMLGPLSYRDGLTPGNDLTGWDFSNQDLSGASFDSATLATASLSGAVVQTVSFRDTVDRGLSLEQLQSTASYQAKNLVGLHLGDNDLKGWDFSGQDLTNATFRSSELIGADLSRANLTNVFGRNSTMAEADLRGANLKNAYFRTGVFRSAEFDSETVYNQWTVFPHDFDPVAAGLTYVPSPIGDLDADDDLDATDLDRLSDRLHFHDANSLPYRYWLPSEAYDFNQDGAVNRDDHHFWLRDLKNTWYGDANLDGAFDDNDMTQVFAAGWYETGRFGASWSQGDWNGNGLFDTSDFVIAFQDGGYEKVPRKGAAAVPESEGNLLLVMGLLPWLYRRIAGTAV